MSRVYTAPIESVTISASGDIWQLATDSSTKARILEWEITTDDTTAQALEYKLVFAATAGSGGTGMDETALDQSNTVTSGCTALAANSTPASTLTDLQYFAHESLGPLGRIYDEKTAPMLDVSKAIVFILTTTPSSMELSGYVTWEEL